MLLSPNYFAVTQSKSMNFYNTSNSFEKFNAACLLKDALEQLRMQTHITNVNSVFYIILLYVFFKKIKY